MARPQFTNKQRTFIVLEYDKTMFPHLKVIVYFFEIVTSVSEIYTEVFSPKYKYTPTHRSIMELKENIRREVEGLDPAMINSALRNVLLDVTYI